MSDHDHSKCAPVERLGYATLHVNPRWATFHDEDGVWRIVTEDGDDVTWPEMDEYDCDRTIREHNNAIALIDDLGLYLLASPAVSGPVQEADRVDLIARIDGVMARGGL